MLPSVIDDYQQLSMIITVYITDVIAIDYMLHYYILYILGTTYIQYCLKSKTNGVQTFFCENGNHTFIVFGGNGYHPFYHSV